MYESDLADKKNTSTQYEELMRIMQVLHNSIEYMGSYRRMHAIIEYNFTSHNIYYVL